ncbi:4-hydroxy-tetrahydrodipicolinate synthase [Hydrogenispora ethanolica]|jgi:4-hydroxy-tetrahydrodipicolinate synthase|uniref:4-hydroxy-tetrahydrodipicolinate synthase n=1 Tax=Hydrogenispora ethanolica TaxID=1082276 RepID=A0A4V2QF07_HYDET|nr:4-hydroxy-tetrahydrodipicolinate synthase [Hydrogenispora ethanolica]TCL70037.1 4-hydroxy-tetrahydrodipicolinate synthase [Hydrogenispora ethanolica]
MFKPEGIIAALVTPLNEDETINEAELRAQVNRQIAAGVHGLFCLGTNGESYILSRDEKLAVIRIVVAENRGRLPVYAGTGCVGTGETIELSRKAAALGVDALSVITPYFAALSQDELYEHFKSVAEAVGLPIVLYNIPARTGNAIDYTTVARLAELPNIVGVKDSSGNFDNILRYLESTAPGRFAVLSGNDSLILWTLQAGGTGGISGIANLFPATMARIYELWRQGDFAGAKQVQDSIRPIRDCLKLGNPNTVVKKAANLLGYPVGPCRRPFSGLSAKAEAEIRRTLEQYYQGVR